MEAQVLCACCKIIAVVAFFPSVEAKQSNKLSNKKKPFNEQKISVTQELHSHAVGVYGRFGCVSCQHLHLISAAHFVHA